MAAKTYVDTVVYVPPTLDCDTPNVGVFIAKTYGIPLVSKHTAAVKASPSYIAGYWLCFIAPPVPSSHFRLKLYPIAPKPPPFDKPLGFT